MRWTPAIGYALIVVMFAAGAAWKVDSDYRLCRDRNRSEALARDTFRAMAALEENERDYPVPTKGAREFRRARARLFRARADAIGPLPACTRLRWR
jgi:hypothetical protein